jgi:hypothetical protein
MDLVLEGAEGLGLLFMMIKARHQTALLWGSSFLLFRSVWPTQNSAVLGQPSRPPPPSPSSPSAAEKVSCETDPPVVAQSLVLLMCAL